MILDGNEYLFEGGSIHLLLLSHQPPNSLTLFVLYFSLFPFAHHSSCICRFGSSLGWVVVLLVSRDIVWHIWSRLFCFCFCETVISNTVQYWRWWSHSFVINQLISWHYPFTSLSSIFPFAHRPFVLYLYVVEAHARMYVLDHKLKMHPLRLADPNDDLGGVLYPSVPADIVHVIDHHSILTPRKYPFIESSNGLTLRSIDSFTGNRDEVICPVCGTFLPCILYIIQLPRKYSICFLTFIFHPQNFNVTYILIWLNCI